MQTECTVSVVKVDDGRLFDIAINNGVEITITIEIPEVNILSSNTTGQYKML